MNQPALIEYDFEKKLEIRINNEKPVVLTDLTLSLLGVAHQFERFIENETTEQYKAGTELYIKEVRSGSIVVDLVAQALPLAPLLWEGGTLLEWANHAKSVIEWLTGKVSKPPIDLAKQDLKQWHQIVEPIAKDHGSQMNFSVSDGGKVINQFVINSEQANVAQNEILRQIESLDEPDLYVHKKRVMIWYQTKFDSTSATGDKAIIESISNTPTKVVFENDAVKKSILAGDDRFHRPWHELAYIVDVRVQTVRGKPKVYSIINFYEDDTFDPDE